MNRPLVIVLAVLVLGIVIMGNQADMRMFLSGMPAFRVQMERDKSDYREDVEVTGSVEWIEEKNGKYILKTDCGANFGTVNIYVDPSMLSEKKGNQIIGAVLRVRCDVFLYQKATNPGEFDIRSYYDADGIFLAMTAKRVTTLTRGGKRLKCVFYGLYERGREILKTYSDASDYAFFRAMLTGKREGLNESFKNNLNALFLFRLFTVSGFFVSSIGMLIVRLMKKRFTHPAIPASTGFFTILLYCLVLGTPVSFLRAVLVFSLRVFAPLLRRSADTLCAASFSLILLLIHRPMLLFQAGLQYYMAVLLAVSILVPAVVRTLRKTGFLFRTLCSLLAVASFLLPLQAYHAYAVSPYGILLPVFLLPLRVLIVLPLLIGIFIGLLIGPAGKPVIEILFTLPHVLRLFFEACADSFRTLPLSTIVLGQPEFCRIFVYYSLLILYVAYFQIQLLLRKYTEERKEKRFTKKAKVLSLSALFILLVFGVLFLRADPLNSDESVYTVLDVGQGDGNLIRTGQQTIAIDIGSSDREDSGEILKNALLYYGISHLSALVFTHGDGDHVGGLKALLESGIISVSEIWIPAIRDIETEFDAVLQLASAHGIAVQKRKQGDRISLRDGASLQVLWPKKNADLSGNAASLVLDYRRNDLHMLFTGDIGEKEEEMMLSSLSRVDVLKVAHHGSRYSSTEAFLSRIKPRYAFLSYGKRNHYGHPADDTLYRLYAVNADIHETGKEGAIEYHACKEAEWMICYGSCD